MILDVLVFYVPVDDTATVIEAICRVGAGRVGNYEECAFVFSGTGQFRPVGDANPTVGNVGELTKVVENRVEVSFPREIKSDVINALRKAHPYEEPAFHVIRSDA